MFSNDDLIRRFAFEEDGVVINPNQPLPPGARPLYGTRIMLSESREIRGYIDFVGQDHSDRQGDVAADPAEPVLNMPARLQNLISAHVGQEDHFGCFHLIYAYLIENTRIYELFSRVIQYFNQGERLGVLQPETRHWLSLTESLFYRQQSVHDHQPRTTITSDLRSDGRALRRNAYYRMFGMDLNHGTDENKPYPYEKPAASNKQFVSILEELLRQLWIAHTEENSDGTITADDGQVIDLARQLNLMLGNRRLQGTLAREEFSAVACLDWLRLAVSFDSPIVMELRAQAGSEAERLKKIGEKVGLPTHGRADDYFELATPMSGLLIAVEEGAAFDIASFLALRPALLQIINAWSRATGKVLKQLPRPVVREIRAA